LRTIALVVYLSSCTAIWAQATNAPSPSWSADSSGLSYLLLPSPSDWSDVTQIKKQGVGVHEIPLSRDYQYYLYQIPQHQGPDHFLRIAPEPVQNNAFGARLPPLVDTN
jgi:hypothetical protein